MYLFPLDYTRGVRAIGHVLENRKKVISNHTSALVFKKGPMSLGWSTSDDGVKVGVLEVESEYLYQSKNELNIQIEVLSRIRHLIIWWNTSYMENWWIRETILADQSFKLPLEHLIRI